MKVRFGAILIGAVLVFGIGSSWSTAAAFCDESEGCTRCDSGPHVILDGKNTRIEWRAC